MALYAAYTPDTVDTVDAVNMVYTVDMIYTTIRPSLHSLITLLKRSLSFDGLVD